MARGKSVVKLLLDSSEAALFAGIEIHNKPHVAYRYPTSIILIINAWELALKAYVYKYVGKRQIYEKDKIHTKGFSKILKIAENHINSKENGHKFKAISENLNLLNEYRNSNIHFIENKLDPVIFMLISKAVLNYDFFVKKYFQKDITKNDNLIILPVGMKLPFDPIDYLKQDFGSAHNEFVNKVVQSVRELNNSGIQESIVVGFDIYADRVRNSNNADIIAALESNPEAVALRKAVRITDDPNAPVMRVEPILLPLSYDELKNAILDKRPDIKINKNFHSAMKRIKADEKLSKPNYLNPKTKEGGKKYFYSYESIDKVIQYYDEITQEQH